MAWALVFLSWNSWHPHHHCRWNLPPWRVLALLPWPSCPAWPCSVAAFVSERHGVLPRRRQTVAPAASARLSLICREVSARLHSQSPRIRTQHNCITRRRASQFLRSPLMTPSSCGLRNQGQKQCHCNSPKPFRLSLGISLDDGLHDCANFGECLVHALV